MSGYTNVSARLPLLRKPFSMRELLEQVAKVIGGPPLLPTDVFVIRSLLLRSACEWRSLQNWTRRDAGIWSRRGNY